MPPRAARAASPAEGEANKRACDVCHNMKVRCIKQANSCKRCLGLGVACTFAREVPVLRTDRERITALETQMSSIHGLLQNMNTLLVQTAQQTTEIAARAKERPTLGEWVTAVSTALPAQAPLGPPDAASPDSLPRGEEREDEYDLDSSEDYADGEEEEAEAEEGEEDEDDEDDEDERLETKDNVAETPSFAPLAEERRVPLRSLLQDEAVLRLRKDGAEGSRKRRRLSSHDAGVADARELAETEEDQDPDDPISLGIVSEPEARHLFDLYFAGSSAYLPAFDPAVDTFDAVRSSSALCFSSILMIGQMAADGEARDASPETRTRLKEHAEKLAMRTLFSPVASLRVVQALILLASWGDTAWRPGNHALAIAVDMGLYRCLPHLVDTGMGKSITDAERERGYVAGARVWLALTKLTLEMTLNHGRPFLLPNDEPVEYSRRLLDHPYSIPTDSRVIAACELMLHRTSQIQPFANNTYIPSRVDVILAEGHATFDEWERFWTGYYRQKGVESSDFLVSELAVQKCHSTLHFNYHVLHGVRSRADVACLPDSRRKWLVRCLEVADSLVERMAKDEELSRLRFANHYAFVALAFAAMYLVRLARILPGADLERIQHNVVVLADKLDQFPGFNFCKLLHSVVRGRKRTQGDKAAATPAEGSTDALRDEGSAADLGFINIGDVGDVSDIGGLGDLGDLGDLGLSMGMPTAMQDESWLDLLVDGGS